MLVFIFSPIDRVSSHTQLLCSLAYDLQNIPKDCRISILCTNDHIPVLDTLREENLLSYDGSTVLIPIEKRDSIAKYCDTVVQVHDILSRYGPIIQSDMSNNHPLIVLDTQTPYQHYPTSHTQ
jgi:hypothetical protein